MTGDRALTPDDAAVAVRSFPRRFRAVLARPEGDDDRFDPDELARRPGADGRSAAEHLGSAIAWLAAADESARTRTPVSPSSGSDDGRPVATLLDELETTATAAADRIDAVPNDQWSTELMHHVQDAVADVAAAIRRAETAIADAR